MLRFTADIGDDDPLLFYSPQPDHVDSAVLQKKFGDPPAELSERSLSNIKKK